MTSEYNYGGLLNNNVYANNKNKKAESENFAQGLLNDPAYQNAIAKNQRTMGSIRRPTANNIQERVNAYSNVTDENMEYPPEVLAEPKKVNMLQEYLFGNPHGFQPSVDQKKLVYKATKNLSTAEKVFFRSNPEKFNEYMMKFGDFAPKEINASGSSADGFTNNAKKTREYFGLGNPDSQTAIAFGGERAKFDPNGDYRGTTKESRMTPDGRVRSYAQMIFDTNQNRDANFTNSNEEAKALGGQGNRVIQTATYDDDGNATWSKPEPFFYSPVQEAIDKNFGTEVYNTWAIQGGFQNEIANIQNFNEVEDLLNDPRATTSGLSYELAPERLTKLYEAGYEPEKDANGKTYAVNNALDLVRAVVFQSLKKTLGGQFTEREAERLVEATYNPSLPPEVNLRRIMVLKSKMIETFRSQKRAVDYFTKNKGTLFGYDTTVSGIDLAELSTQSITDYVDRVATESFSAKDYASMTDDQAGAYYTHKASRLEKIYMKTLFNIKD